MADTASDEPARSRSAVAAIIRAPDPSGPTPRAVQRTTLYQTPDPERVARSMAARGDLVA